MRTSTTTMRRAHFVVHWMPPMTLLLPMLCLLLLRTLHLEGLGRCRVLFLSADQPLCDCPLRPQARVLRAGTPTVTRTRSVRVRAREVHSCQEGGVALLSAPTHAAASPAGASTGANRKGEQRDQHGRNLGIFLCTAIVEVATRLG